MREGLLVRVRRRLRYYRQGLSASTLLPLVLIDLLDKLRITVVPYYLYVEGVGRSEAPAMPSDEHEFVFLGRQDMKTILRLPGRSESVEVLEKRLAKGDKCLGAKRRNELLAFTWCDFQQCGFRARPLFRLPDREAYLYDAYTVHSFRGRGLASQLRYRLYEELAALGYHRLYSISVQFNRPALRFKQKLGAQILALNLFVRFLGRWSFHATLRRYPEKATPVAGHPA